MSQGWSGAGETEWFRDPAAVVARARGAIPAEGWSLDAPVFVPFDRVEAIPAVLARRLSLGEDAATAWTRDATLVVARLDDGAVYVGNAFPALDLPRERGVSVQIPDDGARVSGVELIDVRRAVAGIPWREGTFAVTALVGARRSATVRVTLGRGAARDPEVEALLDARRAVGYPRAVFPPRSAQGDAPFYRAGRHSPRVMGGAGVALHATREGAALMAWGALRAVPRAREIVRVEDPSEARYAGLRGAGWVEVGAPGAVAVLPVTLVARHPDLPEPVVCALQVPSYTPPRGDGAVDAFFGVDLFALPGFPRWDGPWSLWAVSGEAIAGPATP